MRSRTSEVSTGGGPYSHRNLIESNAEERKDKGACFLPRVPRGRVLKELETHFWFGCNPLPLRACL